MALSQLSGSGVPLVIALLVNKTTLFPVHYRDRLIFSASGFSVLLLKVALAKEEEEGHTLCVSFGGGRKEEGHTLCVGIGRVGCWRRHISIPWVLFLVCSQFYYYPSEVLVSSSLSLHV